MTNDNIDAIETRLRTVFEKVFASRVDYRPDLERVDAKHWDSPKHVEFMIALEMEFKIRLDGADATAMTGVARTLETVQGKLA